MPRRFTPRQAELLAEAFGNQRGLMYDVRDRMWYYLLGYGRPPGQAPDQLVRRGVLVLDHEDTMRSGRVVRYYVLARSNPAPSDNSK